MPGRWKPSGVGRRAGAPSGNIAIALDDFTAGDSLSQPVSPKERSREPDVAEVSKKCRRPGLECADAQTIQFLLGPCRNAVFKEGDWRSAASASRIARCSCLCQESMLSPNTCSNLALESTE